MSRPWIVCQLGNREHFAIARARQRRGGLKALVTDIWAPPGSRFDALLAAQGGGGAWSWFDGRFDADLAGADVQAVTDQALLFAAAARLGGVAGWDLILRRNAWFQARVAPVVDRLLAPGDTLFSYSYAARDLFRLARARGCRTVLGQIDAARVEEDLVAEEVAAHPEIATGFRRLPSTFWDAWSDECALADTIVVNSPWAAQALVNAGVDDAKLRVVPLAYEGPIDSGADVARDTPAAFTPERPLRVLFLGQVIARKGVFRLLDAIDRLVTAPITFTIVGGSGPFHAEFARRPNVQDAGSLTHDRVADCLARADLFLLPTLSDGFALTLLEAAAARLPTVCSDRCGEVIANDVGGLVLREITGAAIADALTRVLDDPSCLPRWRRDLVSVPARFSIDRLADRLYDL